MPVTFQRTMILSLLLACRGDGASPPDPSPPDTGAMACEDWSPPSNGPTGDRCTEPFPEPRCADPTAVSWPTQSAAFPPETLFYVNDFTGGECCRAEAFSVNGVGQLLLSEGTLRSFRVPVDVDRRFHYIVDERVLEVPATSLCGDVDGNGWPELRTVGGVFDASLVGRCPGEPSFATEGPISVALVGDFTGSGTSEVVLKEDLQAGGAAFEIVRPDGSLVATLPFTVVAVAHAVEQDGDLGLMFADGPTGDWIWWPHPATQPDHVLRFPGPVSSGFLVHRSPLGDPGSLLLAGNRPSFFHLDGTLAGLAFPSHSLTRIQTGDFDGDGIADVAIVDEVAQNGPDGLEILQRVDVFRGPLEPRAYEPEEADFVLGPHRDIPHLLRVGDATGDGRDDLILSGRHVMIVPGASLVD